MPGPGGGKGKSGRPMERPGGIRRLLIIQTAFLGDVILITPLIRAAHEVFPEAGVDVLVIPETADVLRGNPHLAKVLTFDKRGAKAAAFLKTLREVRRNRYDLAISPHSSFTTALLMKLGGIPARLGFDRWAASRLLTLKVPHLEGVHKVRKNLHLLSVFTGKEFDTRTEVFPDAETEAKVRAMLESLPRPGRPVVVVFPGSIWPTKRWPEEHFTRLVRGMDEAGFNIVLGGAPSEKPLCRRIIEASGAEALDITGRADPLESGAVIARSDLVICNDSAPVHLASAVGTTVFALAGPTDMRKMGYFPTGPADRIFEIELECRPCGPHGARRCPRGHHRCMRDLKPEGILSAVLEYSDLPA
jgi:heptosyltransferase-2